MVNHEQRLLEALSFVVKVPLDEKGSFAMYPLLFRVSIVQGAGKIEIDFMDEPGSSSLIRQFQARVLEGTTE